MKQPIKGYGLFPTLLASTVHDIKNSLGTLLGLIQNLSRQPALSQMDEFQQLEFEANRINHSLMQLLVMYKVDTQAFNLVIDEHPVIEILLEAKSQQERLSQMNQISVEIECDEDLFCYCDYQTVSNALGTILNNAQRYTRSRVLLTACALDGYVRFSIEDDGVGYPQHFLDADLSNPSPLDWVNGNTGLGLYFVAAIARLHQARGRSGYVSIDNQSRFGGARFSLFLP